MSETLNNPTVTFLKWDEPGTQAEGTYDSITWDAPGKFGLESSIRLVDGDGNLTQVKLTASLAGTLKAAEPRLIPGQTHLTITYLETRASKKDPSKTYKAFDVKAEGLAPKGASAPTREPGDDAGSFDPAKLK